MMRFVLFLIWATSLVAQPVEIGVAGGVPLTPAFSAHTVNPNGAFGKCGECASQRTLPYVVGAKIQVHLWRPLYLDGEALFSLADYNHTSSGRIPNYIFNFLNDEKHAVNRWEVPILLKAQLNSWHSVHPFVAGGVSLQHSRDFPIIPSMPGILNIVYGVPNSAIGPTFAAGASFGSRRVRPLIELRYTRWTGQPIVVPQPAATFSSPVVITLHSKQDEAQLLAGLMFGIGRNRPNSRGVLEGPPSSRRVTLGIKGGLLLTEALSARPITIANAFPFNNCYECGTVRTLPFVVGPALEVRIISALSLTTEAFYSRAVYNHTSGVSQLSAGSLDSEEKHAVDRWEARSY